MVLGHQHCGAGCGHRPCDDATGHRRRFSDVTFAAVVLVVLYLSTLRMQCFIGACPWSEILGSVMPFDTLFVYPLLYFLSPSPPLLPSNPPCPCLFSCLLFLELGYYVSVNPYIMSLENYMYKYKTYLFILARVSAWEFFALRSSDQISYKGVKGSP